LFQKLIVMPLYIPVLLAALLSLLGVTRLPILQEENTQAKTHSSIAGLLAYRQGINAHFYTHPNLTGEIDTSLISMPEGFVNKGWWRNHVENGIVFVYSNPDHPSHQDVIQRVYQLTHSSPLVGTNVNGKLIGPTGFDAQLSIPDVIPNGSLVIAGN
jgi:hypothetical protein